MLTTHIKARKNIFGFSEFCRFLFDFSYANFYLVSCKILKAVNDRVLLQVTSRGDPPPSYLQAHRCWLGLNPAQR
jgi:hypothetical protein